MVSTDAAAVEQQLRTPPSYAHVMQNGEGQSFELARYAALVSDYSSNMMAYAYQLHAAGFCNEVVGAYASHAEYYAGIAAIVSRAPPTRDEGTEPVGAENLPNPPVAAAAAEPQANHLPPGDDIHIGAAAGHGNFLHNIMTQLALIAKLAFFVIYFGARATGVRAYALYFICGVTFLWQGGWLSVTRRRRIRVAAEPVGVEEGVEERNEGIEEPGGNFEPAIARVPTEPDEPPPAGAVAAISLHQLIIAVVYRFFQSLLPGIEARPEFQ